MVPRSLGGRHDEAAALDAALRNGSPSVTEAKLVLDAHQRWLNHWAMFDHWPHPSDDTRLAGDRVYRRRSGVGWLLVDSARTDELGQPVVLGPYGTLDAVRGAMPDARQEK